MALAPKNTGIIDPITEEIVDAIVDDSADYTVYSCLPIQKLHVAHYEFAKGSLRLHNDEVEAFDTLVASMPPIDRNQILKLDRDRADAIAKSHMAAASQGTDSATGRAAMEALQKATGGSVGTVALDAK